MSQPHDFPFDITDVAELLHLRIRRPSPQGFYVDCPICNDKRGKMHINTQTDTWRCNYCDESGGMLALYAKVHSISTSAAYREISDALLNGVNLSDHAVKYPDKPKETPAEAAPVADIAVRHKTYTALLAMLTLSTYTAGIMIPARTRQGLISGFQIRLDVPLKNEDDPPEKDGAKYIWFSSAGKPKGTSSGSPAHFVGDPNAGVVYVTEGLLKSDIAHYLMNRSFAATAGVNNMAQLEFLLKELAENGTHTIIESEDMDKYRNEAACKGALKLHELARKYGMVCRGLNWNPNYKGVDDWQLALKRNAHTKEDSRKNFRQRFMYGLCDFDAIDDDIAQWHESTECACELHEYLGLTEEEYSLFVRSSDEFEGRLLSQRQEQRFRIYQLEVSLYKVIPFAFGGIKELQKAGHEYPPAAQYSLIHDGMLHCEETESDTGRLTRIAELFGDVLPKDYRGRSVAPSDVIELYDDTGRRYFYRDTDGFCPVKFSPMLAKK